MVQSHYRKRIATEELHPVTREEVEMSAHHLTPRDVWAALADLEASGR